MTDLKFVALGFALCAWGEFAQAQVQLRTDTVYLRRAASRIDVVGIDR